jgi:hypothetical protein
MPALHGPSDMTVAQAVSLASAELFDELEANPQSEATVGVAACFVRSL